MSTEEPPKRLKVDQAKVEQGLNGLEAPIDLENEEPVADTEEDALLEQELRSAQAELDKENEEMLERMRQVELEYNIRKQPFYKRRGEVIKRIPGFWLHCFMQHEEIRLILGSVDQEILTNLTELEVQPLEDVKASYKIILHFGENEFFKDTVLKKEIRFFQEASQPISCTVSECAPKWRGEDPTKAEVIKSGRKRNRDAVAFFRWFTQPNVFEPGLIDTLADIIKDQLWVNPLEFMDGDDEDGGVPAGEEDAAEYDEEDAEKEGQPTPAGEEPIELWDDEEGDEDVQEQGEGPEAEFGGDLDDEVDEEEGAQLPDDEVDEEEDAQLRELLEAGEEEPDLQEYEDFEELDEEAAQQGGDGKAWEAEGEQAPEGAEEGHGGEVPEAKTQHGSDL